MKIFRKLLACLILIVVGLSFSGLKLNSTDNEFIKWVDCKVPYEVLLDAYNYEKRFYNNDEIEFSFVKALAYLATKNGNSFGVRQDRNELQKLVANLEEGKSIDDFYGGNKYYKYYVEAYTAIFAEFFGEYLTDDGEVVYGLKNYHPFPRGYWYNHYDDFGASRSYGYKRVHLGHDFMGSIGTPLVAIEGGVVTEMGWNRLGGWHLTIRTHDGKRGYYYAHLRKGKPFVESLQIGDVVEAGEVVGYLGVTGYSTVKDTNMTGAPHLHLGLQLIFDESQVVGPTEIWIDMYQISKLLSHNRASVEKVGEDFVKVGY